MNRSNAISHSHKLFLILEWFDKFLEALYPKHFLLNKNAWTLMTAQHEARNFYFVARCLAVAVNTGYVAKLQESANFNKSLEAIKVWTETNMDYKVAFNKNVVKIARNSVNLTDPRGFEIRLNHKLIDKLKKLLKFSKK
jgi:hypothetical protein